MTKKTVAFFLTFCIGFATSRVVAQSLDTHRIERTPLLPISPKRKTTFIPISGSPQQKRGCLANETCTNAGNWVLMNAPEVGPRAPILSSDPFEDIGQAVRGDVRPARDSDSQEVSVPNLNNIRYVTTAEDWSQKIAG